MPGQGGLPLVVRRVPRPEPVDEPAARDGRRPQIDERERPRGALRANGVRVQSRPSGVADVGVRLVEFLAPDDAWQEPLAVEARGHEHRQFALHAREAIVPYHQREMRAGDLVSAGRKSPSGTDTARKPRTKANSASA